MVAFPERADIMIIGGGPTGLTLLSELLHHHARGSHVLVDANIEVCGGSKLPKGQGILASTLELWSRWGDGTIPARVSASRRLPPELLPIFNSWDSEADKPGTPPEPQRVDPALTAWGNGERVPQPYYEAILREHVREAGAAAAEKTGGACDAKAFYGWQVLKVEPCSGEWLVRLAPSTEAVTHYAATDGGVLTQEDPTEAAAAAAVTVRAKTLVGCDGGRSLVRKALGFRFSGVGALGTTLSPLFRSATLHQQLRSQFGDSPEGMFYMFKKPGFPSCFINIVGDDQFFGQILYGSRAELPAELAEAAASQGREEFAKLAVTTLERTCDTKFEWDVEPIEAYLWQPYNLCAETWMNEERTAFIAGDAAHLLSPAGGFGMNGGVADGVNLGWKLAARQNGWLGEPGGAAERAMLASYQEERERSWRRYSDYQRAAVAKDKAEARREAGAPYELASLGPSSRAPVLAERATDVVVSSGARLHRVLAESCSGYTLVLLEAGGSADSCAERFQAALAALGIPCAVHRMAKEPEMLRVYGGMEGSPSAFVFRPDQVLCWAGAPGGLLPRGQESAFPLLSASAPVARL